MNFGDCPYCDDFIGLLAIPEKTPAYAKVKCESCGKEVWYKFSRIDPESWTIEGFEMEFDIDDVSHKIIKKIADDGVTIDMASEDNKKFFDMYFRELDNLILYGDPEGIKPVGILNFKEVLK